MRFAAIDFETATASRDSACALGLALVDDSGTAECRYWAIRPPRNEYSEFNTRIHGIGPEDTRSAPSFLEVYSEFSLAVGDLPIVAHNAAFDLSVLRNCLDAAGQPYPTLDYYCSLLMSRAHWPTLPGYSLPIVLAQCGMSHQHHDAQEDAAAAASVVLQIAADTNTADLPSTASATGVRSGHLANDWYAPCRGAGRVESGAKQGSPFRISDISVAVDADPTHTFYDADVAFTGTLLSMSRPEAMRLVAGCGGRPRTSVSKRTEYLVVGAVEYRSFATGQPSTKMRTALDLRAEGHPVVILSEIEFLEYL